MGAGGDIEFIDCVQTFDCDRVPLLVGGNRCVAPEMKKLVSAATVLPVSGGD